MRDADPQSPGLVFLAAEDILGLIDKKIRPGIRRLRDQMRLYRRATTFRNRPLILASDVDDFLRETFVRPLESARAPKIPRRRGRSASRAPKRDDGPITHANLLERARARAIPPFDD